MTLVYIRCFTLVSVTSSSVPDCRPVCGTRVRYDLLPVLRDRVYGRCALSVVLWCVPGGMDPSARCRMCVRVRPRVRTVCNPSMICPTSIKLRLATYLSCRSKGAHLSVDRSTPKALVAISNTKPIPLLPTPGRSKKNVKPNFLNFI